MSSYELVLIQNSDQLIGLYLCSTTGLTLSRRWITPLCDHYHHDHYESTSHPVPTEWCIL